MLSRLRLPICNLKCTLSKNNIGTTLSKNRKVKPSNQVIENTFKSYDTESAAKTFKVVAAASSVTGIGMICYYAMKKSNDSFSIINKASVWPLYVRDRIHATYTYFAMSNVITAASAVAVFRNPILFQYATRATIPAVILGMVGVIGTGIVMRSIQYDGSLGIKHVAWLLHCSTLGFVVAPVCMLGGQVIQRAALYTLGIVGGLSAVAVTAPSDKFLYMGVPLAMGLGLVFASSLAGLFLNPVSRIGAAALSFQLYGGLVLFGGFLLYDTQNVVKRAETHPPPNTSYDHYNDVDVPLYDPINNSMHIYMDTLNIFIRLATILGMGNTKKR